jgi:hypothetical protein
VLGDALGEAGKGGLGCGVGGQAPVRA